MPVQDKVEAALRAEDARFAAMAASDIRALGEVLADDLHYVHANGMIEDKAEFLRKIESGERDYRSVRVVQREARAENGFVATFGRVEVEVMVKAGLLLNTLDYSAVYRDNDPRLFSWHATKAFGT
jgi:hypothetical protein